MFICCLLFSLNAAGQVYDDLGYVQPKDKEKTNTFMGKLQQVQNYLDSAARAKVDPQYIEVPEKPWRVILRGKENSVDVEFNNSLDFPETREHSDWKLQFSPPTASSIGFWVGYRGTGVSFSKSLTKNSGRYFSVSSTGAKYGFNFRLRRFNTDQAHLSSKDYVDGVPTENPLDTAGTMPAPVWIRSVYVNGYYVLNGRRYSQAAAYNQSVIQRRSAGSLILGATWYQSSFDYADMKNAFYMLIGHGIHRVKVHQANIGIGYGYNFVPFRGFVINAMAMPTLSVYNRVKVYKSDFNYDLSIPEGNSEDYGKWNSETKTWANGKTHKSVFFETEEDEKIDYWELEPETNYGRVQFNVDLRLGIAYNWSNYFIGLQAQFNRFSYKNDECKVVIVDGYARASLGVRF